MLFKLQEGNVFAGVCLSMEVTSGTMSFLLRVSMSKGVGMFEGGYM